MFYSIRHLTRFRYSGPVSESIMEVRMQPRNESTQRCLTFQLSVSPRARVFNYRDSSGNQVHHFDVPGNHNQLIIVAEAVVDNQFGPPMPTRLPPSSWNELDAEVRQGDFWDMLSPSKFARPSEALDEFARTLNVTRRDDPLSFLRELNSSIYHWFEYAPNSTKVDSPIEHALEARKGVCQDFAHVMIALVRGVQIPCRYVSGYLFHSKNASDRSSDGATHAWLEAYLPGLGWTGFDPTNNLMAGTRHIRTAVGADYADVPPTRGIFKGKVETELTVSVRVEPSDTLPQFAEEIATEEEWSIIRVEEPERPVQHQQHQQQQQQ